MKRRGDFHDDYYFNSYSCSINNNWRHSYYNEKKIKNRWSHPMSKNYSFNSKEEFIKLVQSEILTSSEVLEELQISRQSLNSLVKRGKLTPIKELPRDRMFLREEVEARKEAAKELHAKYRPYDE